MKWRRGIKLAVIHFVVAISLMIWVSIPRYSSEKIHALNSAPTLQLAAYQEEGQSVGFAPMCENWRSISWQEKVLESSELPDAILSGWNSDCPAHWTTAGLIGIDIRHHTQVQETASSAAFSLLIAVQWLVLGGLPLVQPRKWWLEPGACITACTVIEVMLLTLGAMIEAIGIEGVPEGAGLLSFLLFFVVLLAWLAWLVLLLWKTTSSGWQLFASIRKKGRQDAVQP